MANINWHSAFFLLFALLACGLAVAVVLSANIVRMAAYLVAALGAVAGLFFLAGAELLGTLQLVVYVGGTMVLLVFGVMLTPRQPLFSWNAGGGSWVLALLVSGALLTLLLPTAMKFQTWTGPNKPVAAEDTGDADAPAAAESAVGPTAARLGLSLLGLRTERLTEPDEVLCEGHSGYLLPFEMVSVHLLVVLVAAAFLARPRRRRSAISGGGRG
jgi:NADH:ubiquinone oxidoreductase subunit 6 (subunit J)